jgi:hypothetical protein
MTQLPLSAPGIRLFEQNIGLGILIVAIASFAFAAGATIQHLAVGRTVTAGVENRSMNVRQLLSLLANPRWLMGLGIVALGAGMHIVALMMAPVTVVQPVGILAVPWSVLLAARIHGFRPSRQIWSAVVLTVIGIVVFTLISASYAAPDVELPATDIIVFCVAVYLIGAALGLIGGFGPARLRCLAWATGGSFFYGLSSALVKTTSELVAAGDFAGRPLFWVVAGFLLCSYLTGGWMVQQGYANGPAEIVVGSMTTTDPIVGVTFGMVVLGEGVLLTPVPALGMLVSGALAIFGVVLLSRFHPEAHKYLVAEPDAEPEAVPASPAAVPDEAG